MWESTSEAVQGNGSVHEHLQKKAVRGEENESRPEKDEAGSLASEVQTAASIGFVGVKAVGVYGEGAW